MAVAFKSVATVTYASANTVTIPKPTGLAVGDLMVAIVHQKDVDTATCARTGWTAIDTMDLNATSGDYAWTLWKIADSTDVAGSNFVFTLNRTAYVAGAIYRIDGHNASTPINAHAWNEQGSNTTNHSVACSITPNVADTLFLMGTFNSGNTTNAGYAISTDNPTWTEGYDVGSAGAGRSFASAYADRSATSASGNAAFTTAANDYSSATLIAIAPATPVGPANLKTVNGLVKASVKTVNGLAIGSVKTYNGLA